MHNVKLRAMSKLTDKSIVEIRKEYPLISVSERMQRAMDVKKQFMNHKFGFIAHLLPQGEMS
jgi:hypothetical protein